MNPTRALVLSLFLACGSPPDPVGPDAGRVDTDARSAPGTRVESGFDLLFADPREGFSLDDWRVLGAADFALAATSSEILLEGSGVDLVRNSFLVSEATYADFELELEVRIEPGGNSGIQVRSTAEWEANEGAGRLYGYQIEVDTSERAWSGGLYDEGRRGWLDPLEGQAEARAAFQVGQWNHYRILCEGARIRSWVNGVACADFTDAGEDLTLTGHLAFQVHSGERPRVSWRNVRLRELP